MRVRRRLLLVLAVLVVVVVAGITYGLAPLVRWIAVAQIHALTDRPTAIDSIAVNLFTGRVSVRGVQVTERDGTTPFAGIEQLDVLLRLPSLLIGHIWIRDLRVAGSTVRVVRLPGGRFNFSDIIDRPRSPGRPLDLTVDHFTLSDSSVSLEDRALPEPRTWTSEHMTVEAHDVSTRHANGRASAHSVTAGAPLAVELREFRLYPIHLIATVQSEGVDLSPLGLYLPPDAPVVLARGRATNAITVALDARAGLRVDGTVHVEDVALVRPGGGDPLALVPTLDVHVAGFSAREGSALQLDRLTVDGALRVRDPAPGRRERYPLSRVRATVADLTWPATTPGRLDALTMIPGGGTLSLAGTLRPPPEATQLRLRLAGVNLAQWAQLVPLPAQVTGVAEADLRMNEPLDTGVPAHVQGTIAVSQLALADGRQEIASARRIEARGLELHWPARLVVSRVLISSPRGTIERDRAGIISMTRLASKSTSDAARARDTAPGDAAPSASPSSTGAPPSPTTPALAVEVGEVAVRDGRLVWRDAAVSPVAQLAVSELEARVTNAGWPLRGPLGVRVGLRPPGGGHVQLDGRIGVDPITADLKVTTKGAELAPYQAYVPAAARIAGTADLELAVTLPPLAERRASLRGSAALARLDVRDGERTVARVERAAATALEVDWPERVTIGRLTLTRPWLLVERDADGGLPLRTLLKPTNGKSGNSAPAGAAAANAGPSAGAAPADTMSGRATPLAVRVATLTVDDGGVRVVDHAISPAFAVDVQSTSLRLDGLSTTGAAPARVDLRGRVGASAELVLRGTVAAFEGPLRVDADGELHEFAVPRTNPYLVRQVGWQTREGRLTTTLRCRIEGDALSAHSDVRVSRLQLARASNQDEAQNRIGLPLGLLTTLMKDRRGDITLSFPVGGHLSDPKFEFRDAIWSAVRIVAVNAITLPVSWVGRVHFTPDSRIERIQIDPVLFEPGTATLTAEGDGQVGKLVAFLDQLPDVALTITPVVSAGDAEALKRRALDAALERLMAESKLSREDVVARLYAKRFPDQLAPADATAMLAALREQTPLPSAALPELADKRLQAVRAATKRAGIDEARLVAAVAVERPNADSRIEIDVREPEAPRGSKFRDALRRLGVPLKDKDARE